MAPNPWAFPHSSDSDSLVAETSTKRCCNEAELHHSIFEIPTPKRTKRDFSGPVIQVCVGPGEKLFHVHQSLICGQSRFFNNACNIGMKETESRVVDLPSESQETFAVYLNYLYNGCICIEDTRRVSDQGSKEANASEDPVTSTFLAKAIKQESKMSLAWLQFVEFYVLAEFLGDDTAKIVAVDQILVAYNKTSRSSKCLPPPHAIELAYMGVVPEAPLRQLILDASLICVRRRSILKWFRRHQEQFLKEFVSDLVEAMLNGRSVDVPSFSLLEHSDYHGHNEDQ